MNIKKLNVITGAALFALFTGGCSILGGGGKPMLVIGEHDYTAGVCRVIAASDASVIEEEYGTECWNTDAGETSFEEYMKPEVQDHVERVILYSLMAENEGEALTEAEGQIADSIAEKVWAGAVKDLTGAEKQDVIDASRAYMLSLKYYRSIENAVGTGEAEGLIVTGRQLVLCFDNDETHAKAQEKMQEVQEKLRSGMALNQLIPLYTQSDEIMVEYRKKDQNQWQAPLFSLNAGDISDVIELDDRLVLFQCIEKDPEDEVLEYRSELSEIRTQELLDTNVSEYIQSNSVTWNYDQWDKVDLSDLACAVEENLYYIYDSVTK